jgi:hypothetical protein
VFKRGAHGASTHATHKEITMYVHEFGLLIAMATPLAVLGSMHAGLWAAGERATLLVPVERHYPRAEIVDTLATEFRVFAPAAKARNEDDFSVAA